MVSLSEHGRGHHGSEIYIYVDDIHGWYQTCLTSNITPEQSPIRQPWGNTEMLVKDPFRNALRFSQENTHPGQSTPNK